MSMKPLPLILAGILTCWSNAAAAVPNRATTPLDLATLWRGGSTRELIEQRLQPIAVGVEAPAGTRAAEVPVLRAALVDCEATGECGLGAVELWGFRDYMVVGTTPATLWAHAVREDAAPVPHVRCFRVWYRKDGHYFAHQTIVDSAWQRAPWPAAMVEAVRGQVALAGADLGGGRDGEKD
jgi:hypothetical protein